MYKESDQEHKHSDKNGKLNVNDDTDLAIIDTSKHVDELDLAELVRQKELLEAKLKETDPKLNENGKKTKEIEDDEKSKSSKHSKKHGSRHHHHKSGSALHSK